MMEERIIELETKITFQERLIETLNEVVVGQQGQIEDLERSVNLLKKQLLIIAPSVVEGGDEGPPPHY